jgi:hypothetical protein
MIETLVLAAKMLTIRLLNFVGLTKLSDKLNVYWSRP